MTIVLRLQSVLVLILLVVNSQLAFGQANAVEPLAHSITAAGRGGTETAIGDTALSQIRNPATVALHKKRRVDFTVGALIPEVRWRNPADSDHSKVSVLPLGNFAVAGPIDDRFSWGTTFYTKAGLGARYRSRYLMIPSRVENMADFKNAALAANLGYRLNDQWSFGIGARGETQMLKTKTTLGPVILDWDRATSYGFGFQGGVHYQPAETFAVGLAYRSRTWVGPLDSGAKLVVPGAVVGKGRIRTNGEFLPPAATLGFMWRPAERWRLSTDVRWVGYRNSSFEEIKIKGLVDGKLRAGYRDLWIVGAGVEYELHPHWTASLGYTHNTKTVDDSNVVHTFSVLPENFATTGLRYTNADFTAGFAYGIAFQKTARGNGASEIGPDFDDIVLREQVHYVTVGVGFSFDRALTRSAVSPHVGT